MAVVGPDDELGRKNERFPKIEFATLDAAKLAGATADRTGALSFSNDMPLG